MKYCSLLTKTKILLSSLPLVCFRNAFFLQIHFNQKFWFLTTETKITSRSKVLFLCDKSENQTVKFWKMSSLLLTIIPEVLFWCYFMLVVVSETMRYRSSTVSKYRSKTGKKLANRPSLLIKEVRISSDAGVTTTTDAPSTYARTTLEQITNTTVATRGERTGSSIREIRRHQRSMKMKYAKNRDNLLYFCYYKGITAKYYETLRQC